jgi:hypothetical protein
VGANATVAAGVVATLVLSVALHACGVTVRGAAEPLADGGPGVINVEGGASEAETQGQVTACTEGETACGDGACSDLTSSATNCGTCGNPCAEGTVCEASACVVFCEAGQLRCSGACADPKIDPRNCGGCGIVCGPGLVCSDGSCVTDCGVNLTRCTAGGGDSCVNLTRDAANCGVCGRRCSAGETCEASQCTQLCAGAGTLGDTFGPTMVGCKGRARYASRASFCPANAHVCTAAEYVARRAGKRPAYNYWTADNLRYSGSSSNCRAVTSGGSSCGSDNPMRVCSGRDDPLGNECNWTACGFETNDPNEWLGGCVGNTTAGVLCCK